MVSAACLVLSCSEGSYWAAGAGLVVSLWVIQAAVTAVMSRAAAAGVARGDDRELFGHAQAIEFGSPSFHEL